MNTKQYTAAHVANYFLSSAYSNKIEIDSLKLMKLVYFSYAWYLYLTNKDLFKEDIQAWLHGPVIPSLYHEFKHFGLYGKLDRILATHIDLFDVQEEFEVTRPIIPKQFLQNDIYINQSVYGVWQYYKDYTGVKLEKISHEEGSPWQKNYKPYKNIIMNDSKEQRELIQLRAKSGYQKAMKKFTEQNLLANK